MATSTDPHRKLEEEDQDEELDEQRYMSVKDAVLFAVDISDSMLQKLPPSEPKKADQDCAAIAALKCAYQLMQQRIISNPNDKMGIILFGTEKSKFDEDEGARSGNQYPHCYLLMDLDVPSAEDIKRVRTVVEDEGESNSLLVPSDEPAAMSNLLFCANQIFTTRAQNFTSRRLFLVTDNDNPHGQSKDLKSSAVVRAKDLYDLGVTIELFPIAQHGKDFDTGIFYDDIVYRPPTDPDAPAPISRSVAPTANSDGISILQSLIISIHQKIVPKRALFSNLPFELGPDLCISVKGYVIFKRQVANRSSYVYLDGERAILAHSKTTRFSQDTGQPVPNTEVRKAYRFGGENILFTQEEQSHITNFGDPVIRIIGFKPLSMLPPWANTKHATFIYPSEEDYVGSTRTFSALQQTLLRKRRMGLVWFIPRRNAAPTIAALLPGAEKLGKEGEQILPPGLWIRPLPFADDIRNNPEINALIRAPDILKDKMRDVIRQLQLPGAEYKPDRYPNPALQWHYRVLQAMALDEDMPDRPDDKTIPRYRQIDKRAGAYVIAWGEALQAEFDKFRRENAKLVPGAKRDGSLASGASSAAAAAAAAKKKPKAAAEEMEVLTDEQMRTYYHKNSVGKLTMPQLKGWLKEKRLGIVGKKSELVDRVENYFEDKMAVD